MVGWNGGGEDPTAAVICLGLTFSAVLIPGLLSYHSTRESGSFSESLTAANSTAFLKYSKEGLSLHPDTQSFFRPISFP